MCNKLHDGYKPIKRSGIGYKVFTMHGNAFLPMFSSDRFNSRKVNKWDSKRYRNRGDGFCFFLTKKRAEDYRQEYPGGCMIRKIAKIKYQRGLGKVSHNIYSIGNNSFTFSLCKEFQILEVIK
jgi:hypothetical protein